MINRKKSPTTTVRDHTEAAVEAAQGCVSVKDPRYLEWVRASRGLNSIRPTLTDLVNGLGIIDVKLAELDEGLLEVVPGIEGRIDTAIDLEVRALSLLWVLGAYELIRTLDQRARECPDSFPEPGRMALRDAKAALARVRMPLAKVERGIRSPKTDFDLAFPIVVGGKGLGWSVGPGHCISRRALADEVLGALSVLRGEVACTKESSR